VTIQAHVMTKQPRLGPGRFRWNTGAWFGAMLGSTLWLLIAGILTAVKDPVSGWIVLLYFLVANNIGTLLRSGRDRYLPYYTFQGLLAVIGVSSFGAILILDWSGHLQELDPRFESPLVYYGILPLIVGLMVWFHVTERAAMRKHSGVT
jgi:hypothetical protein